MIPVKTVLLKSKTLFIGRMPVRLSNGMQLRNRTAILKRGITNRLSNPQRKSNEIVRKARSYASVTTKQKEKYIVSVNMKWAVLTGVTIVLGTLLLTSRRIEEDEDSKKDSEDQGKRYKKIRILDNNWLFFCYSTLPLNAISRLWGQVNSYTLPIWLRPSGFKFYSYLFGVNLDEMENPNLEDYANLSDFFYRNIRPETRPVAPGDEVIVCPSDGKVLQIGIINSETGEVEQVKGLTYSIKEFLGTHSHPLLCKSESTLDLSGHEERHQEFARANKFKVSYSSPDLNATKDEEATDVIKFENEGDKTVDEYNTPSISKTMKLLTEVSPNFPSYTSSMTGPEETNLYFAVIYLAPGDYHHFHSPINWVCRLRRHFPGDLFSVAPYFQRNFPNLFVLNERVALLGYWRHGFFSMTPVGATNVGSIKLNFDEELKTNAKRRKIKPHTCYEAVYEKASKVLGGLPLTKGEEMGGFMLGSTVVLCFEAPKDFQFHIKTGEKVKMGQKLGSIQKD